MRGKTVERCGQCGYPVTSGGICPDHPMASIIKFRPEHVVAWVYLCTQADKGLAGERLDEFCDSFAGEIVRRTWPGPDRRQMEQALVWARRWADMKRHGLREFRETGTPLPPVSPEGLYGRRQGPRT